MRSRSAGLKAASERSIGIEYRKPHRVPTAAKRLSEGVFLTRGIGRLLGFLRQAACAEARLRIRFTGSRSSSTLSSVLAFRLP